MSLFKRLLILAMAAMCAAAFLCGAEKSITLVSPSGTNLNAGQSAFIHWTYTGYAENTMVRIVLWQNGAKLGDITDPQPIQNPAQNKGHGGYFWTVGKYKSQQASPGCGFTVNLRVQDAGAEHQMSSAAFCIAGPGQEASLKVASPNGGEVLDLGSQHLIRWTSSGLAGNVKIRLRKAGWSMDRAIADSVPVADGKFSWKVGDLLDPHPDLTEATGGLKVVVTTLDGKKSDESDSPFSVKEIKQLVSDYKKAGNWIKVSTPKADETYRELTVCLVSWTFSDDLKGKKASLLLLRPDNSQKLLLEAKLPLNINDYKWNIPSASTLVAGDYKLRLRSNDSPEVYGDSGVFHLAATTIKVTAPKTGEIYARGDKCEVIWIISESMKGKQGTLTLWKTGGQQVCEFPGPVELSDRKCRLTLPAGKATMPAGDYRIKLASLDYDNVWDFSGWFKVLPDPVPTPVKRQFSPSITNKAYRKHSYDEGDFILDPNTLEFADPGNCCCRIGWNHLCDDHQKTRYIYRSHLAINISEIKKGAKVLSASLNWREIGSNPTAIHLYKLTAPWDGDPGALFSIPCVAINPNDAAQMKALAQEWVNNPNQNYGLVFTGADESFSCGSAKTSIHILGDVVFHVETEEMKIPGQ